MENVYTQHNPHLSQTLEALLKGRLKDTSYPFIESPGPTASMQRPQDVIIFMIGGTTYEEARVVSLLNQDLSVGNGPPGSTANTASGTRILLGRSGEFDRVEVGTRVICPSHYPIVVRL